MLRTLATNRVYDRRGSLSAIEFKDCPFIPQRIYYLYDIPGGESQRGGHANRKCHRLLFALSGSFQVYGISPGGMSESVTLNRPWIGIEIPPMTWLELREFSSGAVCVVLASEPYDPEDYVRDFEEWKRAE